MRFFWLNQRQQGQGYSDVIGEVYNYRSNVPGHKRLAAGDYFVYYWPGEYVLFGAGQVETIETRSIGSTDNTQGLTEYNAHIGQYVEFEPHVSVRDIKNHISFLQDREGLRGVPQNSIYEISQDDYMTILAAAGHSNLVD